MVVKESRGRRRYVAFSLGTSIPKSELESGLSASGNGRIHVIQCAGGWCIIRCGPKDLDAAKDAIIGICPGSESKSTSGNLLTLRKRYPILWETRPRYIAFTVSADSRTVAEGLESRKDADGPSLKFCGSGYAIVRSTLRDVERTKVMMKGIDPDSEAFMSSYESKDLRKAISDRCPELRKVLFARR